MTIVRSRARCGPMAHFVVRARAALLSKRCFDIAFSGAVLVLCAPLLFIVALAVAASSPGPIFYIQQRVGKNHRPFQCVKFRTMIAGAEEKMAALLASSPALSQEFADNQKLKADPRVTPLGRFLRFTSLDEFPQFWNVLWGDMSVVGPRPLVPEELYRYGRHIDRVLTVRPGITGLWQVSGRNNIPYRQRVQIDLYYANNHSWHLDTRILLRTFGVLLLPHRSGAC